MSSVKCDSAVMFGFVISLVVIFRGVVVITSARNCSESQQGRDFCGDYVEIKYPFWYDNYEYSNGSGYNCGYPGFGIKCVEKKNITVMNFSDQLYLPINIHYEKKYLVVKEIDIDQQECPHPKRSFSLHQFQLSVRSWTFYYNCSTPQNDIEKFRVRCLDNSGLRSYAFPNQDLVPKLFNETGNCEKPLMTPQSINEHNNYTTDAKQGFLLRWSMPHRDCEKCESSGGLCIYNSTGVFQNCSCGSDFSKEFDKTCPPPQKIGQSMGLAPGVSPSHQPTFKSNQYRQRGLSTREKLEIVMGLFASIGVLLVVLLLTYRWIHFSLYCLLNCHWRNNIKSSTNVDTFLESCGSLALQRYRYSDIKQMTNLFKEILGEGGYGCVFKGKLKGDGRLVAVKMLNESKGNGEDFINEVATIGRTNHVNVVSLLGFCTEGTKRALVYEFMPNGSLERFIYNEKTSSTPLGLEKLYQIALGIARGLDYLHRGCNTRILHFDIKPHNILLDQEFCPKISDFGLAKLCLTRESVVSMLVARGTIGYIAPEVYCRNFGGVSHKSDVYSYGMMVLEMIGGRKNIDPTVENVSEIYFPQWIYNHLNQNIDVEGSGEIFQDATTKKMIIVALWCVQTQPTDRPSINKVVEMLEGSTEELQLPPNPFQVPPSRSSPP